MVTGLSAGWMDRDITLQIAARLQSESGEVSFDWDNATSVALAAQWVPSSTREGYLAQRQIGSYIDGAYKIHYRTEPRPDESRIIGHDGRTYDVKPAIEIGREEGWLVPVVARGEG